MNRKKALNRTACVSLGLIIGMNSLYVVGNCAKAINEKNSVSVSQKNKGFWRKFTETVKENKEIAITITATAVAVAGGSLAAGLVYKNSEKSKAPDIGPEVKGQPPLITEIQQADNACSIDDNTIEYEVIPRIIEKKNQQPEGNSNEESNPGSTVTNEIVPQPADNCSNDTENTFTKAAVSQNGLGAGRIFEPELTDENGKKIERIDANCVCEHSLYYGLPQEKLDEKVKQRGPLVTISWDKWNSGEDFEFEVTNENGKKIKLLLSKLWTQKGLFANRFALCLYNNGKCLFLRRNYTDNSLEFIESDFLNEWRQYEPSDMFWDLRRCIPKVEKADEYCVIVNWANRDCLERELREGDFAPFFDRYGN